MKRVAEKQLSKDDEDIEEASEEVGTGFKKADDAVLARRPIRGLPRRSAATTNASASAAPEVAAAPPRFSGFSGFGSGATSSTPFSFATPSATTSDLPKPPAATPAASPFSLSGAAPLQPPSLFGTSVSSSASPATKAFASIVSSSSTPAAPTPTAPSESASKGEDKEIEYYKALRGLNVSLLSAISKAIEADPFVDVAELLERYKSLRISVGSDKPKPSSSTSPSGIGASTSAPKAVESVAKAPTAPSFAMPAPPSGFSGFKPPTASSSSSPSTGGFVPKIDAGSTGSLGSPFSFAAPKSTAPETSSTSEKPKSAFTFGPSSSSSSATSSSSTPFSFGGSSSGGSLFGKPSASSSSSMPSFFGSSAPPSTSIFGGGSLFGKPSDTPKETEDDKSAEKESTAPSAASNTSSSTSSFFGSTSTPGVNPFATSTPEKTSPPSSAPFSFGSASPGKNPLFSGFPKAGSIGNPVGFGFGSPPKTPDAETASGPTKSLPFSFGAPKFAGAEEKDESNGSSEGTTPAPAEGGDAAPQRLPASSSAHDAEGEGEEDEVTTHEIRSKVYKLAKDKEGKSQWSDLGVGVLRLKKHKETESRRMLLRNSSTGKITINFILHSGMNTAVSDKVVSFMGHDNGQSTPYRIRTKTADQANQLKEVLDREIEFVKAKSEAL
ncbi:hypothetical protein C8Q79DRAFT_927042 [Trametes meyenii]|nr:hypothetical protein C8Q79DRAFT_927042 [Trametes meyenii]